MKRSSLSEFHLPMAGLLLLTSACSSQVLSNDEWNESLEQTESLSQALENCQPSTYEAEAMYHSTGGSTPGGWNIWTNGYISTTHVFEGGTTTLTAVVKGTFAGGAAPNMAVTIGGTQVFATQVGSSNWTPYNFTVEAPAGSREVRIYFTNDYYQNGQDRNLLVDKLVVGCGLGLCGNGVVNPGEQCDDGNQTSADSCKLDCTWNVCGDGTRYTMVTNPGNPNALEACDDGNQDNFDQCTNACTVPDGWVPLTLMNGWTAESNSHVPAVKLVDGVVTFRGGLDGTSATGNVAFCLTPAQEGAPDYTSFRPEDAGWITLRAAMADGATGSLTLSIGVPEEFGGGYCMAVSQHGESTQPGPAARLLTSLEGVAFDSTIADSVKLQQAGDWEQSPYPWRGSDSVTHPEGGGIFAKLVNGFVRFEAVSLASSVDVTSPVLFTLPSGQGMIPGNPVYLPVTLDYSSQLGTPVPGRLVVQPNGQVIVEGAFASALNGVSLDGASYSMSSPPSAQPINLSHGWVPTSSRAVRARTVNGVVRLEGAVTNGSSTTLGSLPYSMRPAKSIILVSNALQSAEPATLRVDTTGAITVLSPALAVASSGISLDSISFGL